MMKFLKNLWGGVTTIYDWLFPEFETFSDNEAGDLIRRYLIRQSWFDLICSHWSEQGFLNKLFYATSSILIGGLIGIVVGAPTILVIFTSVLVGLAHTLMMTHEKTRRARAKFFAEESLALGEILQESTNFFKLATAEVSGVSQELKSLAEDIKQHAIDVDAEVHKVKEECTVLAGTVNEIHLQEERLVLEQERAGSSYAKIAEHLQMCDKSIIDIMTISPDFKKAVADFSQTVRNMELTHQKLFQAVDSISLLYWPVSRLAFKSHLYQA